MDTLDNMEAQEYSPVKLAELIMYVCEKSLGDQFFGRVKLNKALFYSDFTAFRETGHSITGAVYQHLPQGPCPHQLLPALNSLGPSLVEKPESTYVGTRKRLIPTRDADRSVFERDELTIVDRVLRELAPLNSAQVSELSHETMAWRLTEDGQEIPYGTAFLDSEEPTADDLAWLKEVSERGGMAAVTG